MKSNETHNRKVTEKDDPIQRGDYLTEVLKPLDFGPVTWVQETGSTNSDLLEKSISEENEGMVIIADFQTSGRGRRERQWIAEADSSLLMSVLFRADSREMDLGVFSSGVAIAACEALDNLGFGRVRIKWPNDLVVLDNQKQAKLAGVLAQSLISGGQASIVVGIGINVHPSNLGEVLTDREIITLSNIGMAPDRVLLAEKILTFLAKLDFRDPNLWTKYRSFSATLGDLVRITTETGVILGEAIDITGSGSLLVLDHNGKTHEITVGDLVSLRPV